MEILPLNLLTHTKNSSKGDYVNDFKWLEIPNTQSSTSSTQNKLKQKFPTRRLAGSVTAACNS